VRPDEANYTWDYYFGYLIDIGVRTFALGGYAIRARRNSLDFGYHASGNKTGFEVLRKQVDKVGGRILADLRGYGEESFDKAAFLESAAMFTKDFPVDGFQLLTEGFASILFLKRSLQGYQGTEPSLFTMTPRGIGSVIFAEGRGFYFFSQRRAVSKIELAKKHGLRGIGLLGSDDLLAGLYPWDLE
ncbi:hypothetical protein FOZ62_004647, partial [Perkinsus olseni]